MKNDRFFTSLKMTALLLALLVAGQGAWAQNMTTSEITVSFSGMSNGSLYSYVIASGSHTYQSGTQSGAYASFSNASFDIGTKYGAYDLPLSMTLNGKLSFGSTAGSDAVVQDGSFTLTFTSTSKYILSAEVTNGADVTVGSPIEDNATTSLTVSLPTGTVFRNVKLQVTFADYATLENFTSLGNNTYAISSKEDLAKLAGIVNVQIINCKGLTFRQTETITCDNTYSPIGYFQTPFQGTYDGQDYTISGISVNRSNRDIGLFGCVSHGTIMNVVLTHSSFSGNFLVGGIAGDLNNACPVQNCRVLDVTISASGTDASGFGAIVGHCDNADCLQNNYYRSCSVCGNTTQVGIGYRTYSSDCDGARSLHTITPYFVSVSGGRTVVVDNLTCYAAGVPITVSYTGGVSDGQIPQFYYNDGTDHDISGNTLAMPAADISLSATLISAQSQITARPAYGRHWTTFYDGLWRYQLLQGATAYTMGYDHHLYRLGDDGRTIPAGKAYYKEEQIIDLASLTGNSYTAQDGDILTGECPNNFSIEIADHATVTLSDANIQPANSPSAGIKCLGNATIILVGTNTVKAGKVGYAGIQCGGSGTTLTIRGTGSLTATGMGGVNVNFAGAGIGNGSDAHSCGDIRIEGGAITAIGGVGAAGIGCGYSSAASFSCGSIYISGGTIIATGGDGAAAVGCGYADFYRDPITHFPQYGSSTCGNITITRSVTNITATKGSNAPYSIGKGRKNNDDCTQECGTITIGGVDYGTDGIATNPFIYTP